MDFDSSYAGFQVPLPVRQQVQIEVIDMEEVTGKTPDDNGEVSSGLSFNFSITGPESAKMSDQTSAVGFSFSQKFWLPRKSLFDSKPKYANGMKAMVSKLLAACFGENFSGHVEPQEWLGRSFIADIRQTFDKFNKENVIEIERVYSESDLSKPA